MPQIQPFGTVTWKNLSLANGQTLWFSSNGIYPFYIHAGLAVKFYMEFDQTVSVKYGYENTDTGNQYWTATANKTSALLEKNPWTTTGNYRFGVQNLSANTIKITKAEVTF